MAKSKKRRASNRPTYQPSPKITSALSKAESLIEDRRYEEAKALLVPLAESHPRSRPVLLALIEICQEQQDWAGFVRYSEQLLPLERGMERASTLNNLVFAHTQLVYPALAWQAAQELVNEYPDHPQVEKFKRLMQTTETFLREHSADLPTVANLPPDEQMELLLLHDRVRLYTASGQAEKAIAAAESLLAKAPDFIPGLNNLSLAYFTVGRVDQAIATAQRVLALVPDNFHALGNLTRYHFLTARFETAGDYAARLQRLIDGPSDLETKQAEALAFLGDDRGVRAVYERARKRTAELEPVLLHLAAAAHYRLGDEKTAWRLWREAVKREPTLSLAQENLADQRRPVGERDAPWYWSMHYWLPPDFGQSLKQLTAEPLRSKSEEAAQRAFNALLDRYPYLPQLFPHILERGDRAAREMVIGLIRLMGRPELARILVDFALGR
ncbi:MAG: tetratricopeptide repeat protein [Chloroflexota bacterium]